MNGIERDLKGRARVVRLNLLSRIGRSVAVRHEVAAVPTTIVFDGAGHERYRQQGLPSRKKILQLLAGS